MPTEIIITAVVRRNNILYVGSIQLKIKIISFRAKQTGNAGLNTNTTNVRDI